MKLVSNTITHDAQNTFLNFVEFEFKFVSWKTKGNKKSTNTKR